MVHGQEIQAGYPQSGPSFYNLTILNRDDFVYLPPGIAVSRSVCLNHENIHQYSAQGIDIQSKLWTNVSQINYLYSQ
jgi:hypothetical protein